MHVLAFLILLLGALPAAAQDAAPTASVAVEPVGYATYPIPTQAAEIGYFMSPIDEVTLSYAKGTTTQLLAKYDAQLALVRYKAFVGAMSHFNFGLGYRSLASRFVVKTASEDVDVKMASAAVVGEASFGNQVLMGPFFVGCDWIGITAPLAKLASKSNYPDDADEQETEDYEQAFGNVAYKPILQFMRVYVGAAF